MPHADRMTGLLESPVNLGGLRNGGRRARPKHMRDSTIQLFIGYVMHNVEVTCFPADPGTMSRYCLTCSERQYRDMVGNDSY